MTKLYHDEYWNPFTGEFSITVTFEYDGKRYGVTEDVTRPHQSHWTKLESVALEMYTAIREVRALDKKRQGSIYL